MSNQVTTIKTAGAMGARRLAAHLEQGWEPVPGVDAGKGRTMLRRAKPSAGERFGEFLDSKSPGQMKRGWL
jgi:hypothetical protein